MQEAGIGTSIDSFYEYLQKLAIDVDDVSATSICPTLGGMNPGLQAELVHSMKEHLSLICGCSLKPCSSAFASDDSAFASHN